jgi:hypothetical protein
VLQAMAIHDRFAGVHQVRGIGRQKLCRFMLNFQQVTRQALVFSGEQNI